RAGAVEVDGELGVGTGSFHGQDRAVAELLVAYALAAFEVGFGLRFRRRGVDGGGIELHRRVFEEGHHARGAALPPPSPRLSPTPSRPRERASDPWPARRGRGGPRRPPPRPRLLLHLLRDLRQEGRWRLLPELAVHAALEGVQAVQLLARAGHADVAEAA